MSQSSHSNEAKEYDISLIHGNDKASNYAYVFSVFKDASYLLGALAAAFSIKQVNSPNDVVLMATDIPNDMIDLAKGVFDRIYIVPYLKINARPLRTEKQRERYDSWMNVACTKWNCLALVDYRKVIFVDADKLILSNIDYLFELPTPAGTFSSPQAQGYCLKGGMHNPYGKIEEGQKVSDRSIACGLDGTNGPSFTVIGTMVVLTPSLVHYEQFKQMISEYTADKPFGYPTCNSSIDEQALVHFYSRGGAQPLNPSDKSSYQWTYVSQRHGWICWRPEWLRQNEFPPTVIHYFGLKAWKMKRTEWLDLEPWWKMVKIMINNGKWTDDERNKVANLYGKDQLDICPKKECFYCKLFKVEYGNHEFMDAKCSIFQKKQTSRSNRW